MTCDLDYSKQDGKEILRGTFTSVNANSNTDCGGGIVYLERVQQSDFHKEDFLLKKKPGAVPSPQNKIAPKVAPPVVNDVSKNNAKKLQSALGVTPDGAVGPKTLAALKRKLPGFNDKLDLSNSNQVNDIINQVKKANATAAKKTPPPAKPSTQKNVQPPAVIKKDTIAKTVPPAPSTQNHIAVVPQKKMPPVPDVIKTRSNPLIKTITTNSNDIKVELYDNGDIDGDTITVYDNNEVIAWKKGLTGAGYIKY